MLTLPLVALSALGACGDEAEAPAERESEESPRSSASSDDPAPGGRATVEITAPRPPSVTVTPPQPGSVEVN